MTSRLQRLHNNGGFPTTAASRRLHLLKTSASQLQLLNGVFTTAASRWQQHHGGQRLNGGNGFTPLTASPWQRLHKVGGFLTTTTSRWLHLLTTSASQRRLLSSVFTTVASRRRRRHDGGVKAADSRRWLHEEGSFMAMAMTAMTAAMTAANMESYGSAPLLYSCPCSCIVHCQNLGKCRPTLNQRRGVSAAPCHNLGKKSQPKFQKHSLLSH